MKNIKNPSIYIIILLIIGMAAQSATAQQEGQCFLITKWNLEFPANGDHEDVYYLLAEWDEKIVLANPKIISKKTVVQSNENNTWRWVTITEYGSKDDIESAAEMEEKLIAEGWPEQKKRKLFFQAFDKYSITHSDGIIVDILSQEQSYLSFD